jgi:hypothetical protein
MVGELVGRIQEGDAVKTLNRKKAVYGRVVGFRKRRTFSRYSIAIVKGRTQPGADEQTLEVHVEDLDLIREGELAPEDRRANVETPDAS